MELFANEYYDSTTFFGYAIEGLFGPSSVESLLKHSKKVVYKRCKTVEDCNDYLATLQEESKKFTDLMGEMMQAKQEFNVGNIDKHELKSKVGACSAQIKSECHFLKLSDINKSATNVTEEEIANLKAYITGLIQIVKTRKDELNHGGAGPNGVGAANESFTDVYGNYYEANEWGDWEEVEPAQEGLFDRFTKSGKEARAEVAAMDDGTLLKLYAAEMKNRYGRDIDNNADALDGNIKRVGGVAFSIDGDSYTFYVSRGKGKGSKGITATKKKMQSVVTSAISARKKAASKAEKVDAAVEALADFLLVSGQCDTMEDAIIAVEQFAGLTDDSYDYRDNDLNTIDDILNS